MTLEAIAGFFVGIKPVEVPEISGFDSLWLTPEHNNPDGIQIVEASWYFRQSMVMPLIAGSSIIAAERLYVGTLAKHLPLELTEHIGPINLGQFHWFIKDQPEGESGRLISTGWWNNARIREAPGTVASARFSDPARTKKGRFTMDPIPPKRGWVFDRLEDNEPKYCHQGRLLIFSARQ